VCLTFGWGVTVGRRLAFRHTVLGTQLLSKCQGPLQTPCALLPLHAPPHAYIRLALRILRASPCAHPLYSYASGRCAPTPVAVRYEREVEANVARARVLAASLEAAP